MILKLRIKVGLYESVFHANYLLFSTIQLAENGLSTKKSIMDSIKRLN